MAWQGTQLSDLFVVVKCFVCQNCSPEGVSGVGGMSAKVGVGLLLLFIKLKEHIV